MFGASKSYTNRDVEDVALLIREIDENAEEEATPIAGGLLEWARENPNNKRKVNKAFGIIHGIVLAKYPGDQSEFEKYFKSVIVAAYNLGFGINFGKMMYRNHARLRKDLDAAYFEGKKEGIQQVATGENFYLKHRKTW